MKIEITPLLKEEILSRQPEIGRLYTEGFSMPEGAGRDFIKALVGYLNRPGFRFIAAQEAATRSLIGFALGSTGLPGQSWREFLAEKVDPELKEKWLDNYFEFIEFAVLAPYRKQGTGEKLHNTLLSGLAHSKAILTVREQNRVAQDFYTKRGWQTLHQGLMLPSGRGPYRIMGLRIRD